MVLSEEAMINAFVGLIKKRPAVYGQTSASFTSAEPKKLLGVMRIADGFLLIDYRGEQFRFVLEFSSNGSAAGITQAYQQAIVMKDIYQYPALVVIPYLRPEYMEEFLESGIPLNIVDLSGNALINDNGLHVFVKGNPNLYVESRGIKNVFRGSTALVPRAFVKQGVFESVKEIARTIANEKLHLAAASISKALVELEKELIIRRSDSFLTIWNISRLLKRIDENYQISVISEVKGKLTAPPFSPGVALSTAAQHTSTLLTATGKTSFRHYVSGASSALPAFYVSKDPSLFLAEIKHVMPELQFQENSPFPNVRLLHCEDQSVYFDRRETVEGTAASPLQAYLELKRGDDRETDFAEKIYEQLIKHLKGG